MDCIEVDLLIVGGGMATASLLRSLEERDYEGTVGIACAEVEVGYNRILLPTLLAGDFVRRSR